MDNNNNQFTNLEFNTLISHYENTIKSMSEEIVSYKNDINNLNSILENNIRMNFEYQLRKYKRSTSDSVLLTKKH